MGSPLQVCIGFAATFPCVMMGIISEKLPSRGGSLSLALRIRSLHLSIAELNAKKAILADRASFQKLQTEYLFDSRGRYIVDPRALIESLRKLARTQPTKAQVPEHAGGDMDQPDPWEDSWFEEKREQTHSQMAEVTSESLARAIEAHQVIRVDEYRFCSCR